MRSSALVLLHLLLAVLLAFDGMGAALAAAGPAPSTSHAAHSGSETPPPCHSTVSDPDAVADAAHERHLPAPDSCCDGGDCLCLHGCGSVLPVVPRIAASSSGAVVAIHVPEDRAAPRLDDPVRPPIHRT